MDSEDVPVFERSGVSERLSFAGLRRGGVSLFRCCPRELFYLLLGCFLRVQLKPSFAIVASHFRCLECSRSCQGCERSCTSSSDQDSLERYAGLCSDDPGGGRSHRPFSSPGPGRLIGRWCNGVGAWRCFFSVTGRGSSGRVGSEYAAFGTELAKTKRALGDSISKVRETLGSERQERRTAVRIFVFKLRVWAPEASVSR